jgi:hypothetical protein
MLWGSSLPRVNFAILRIHTQGQTRARARVYVYGGDIAKSRSFKFSFFFLYFARSFFGRLAAIRLRHLLEYGSLD